MKKEYEMVFIVKPIEKKQFEVAIQKIENIILNFVQILTRKDLPLHTI